jgi:hypothetical protein
LREARALLDRGIDPQAEREKRAEAARQMGTLGELVTVYLARLEKQGRRSVAKVRYALAANIPETLVALPAKDADRQKWVAKDLRRTVKTRMGELGIPKDIRDRLQNHALQDVSTRHYDRYDYLPEKRKALENWCQRLSAVVASDTVIPLPVRARAIKS